MEKKLSIVIPRYNESERDIFPLLSSIHNQVGVDFDDLDVIIVTDGGGKPLLSDDFLGLFHFGTAQIQLKNNAGPGVARQAGLDAAKSQYVMFCDADDVLHNVGVIGAFLHEANINAPDILSSPWLEELPAQDGSMMYLTHENENTWMHGKIFRTQFLRQNGIRFSEKLRVHEDSYFLSLAAAASKRSLALPATTYVWKYHPGSITRKDGAIYTYASVPAFVEAVVMAFDEVMRLNPSMMEYKVVQFILYNYFTLHQPHWLDESKAQFLKAGEDAIVENLTPYMGYWHRASRETIQKIYNEERAKNFSGGLESETLEIWLSRLGLIGHELER